MVQCIINLFDIRLLLCCRELVLGFLKDRTRVLVTHNMALCVASADLVVCINSVSSSGSSTAPRSEVVACCPPSELNGVIQKLRQLTTSSERNVASSGNSGAAAGSPRAGSGDGAAGISDLSVFLEGLVAAAALVSKEGGTGSGNSMEKSVDSASTTLSLHNPIFSAQNTTQPIYSNTPTITTHAAPTMVDESPRTVLRRQNFSYESLRKGITTVTTPSNGDEVAASGGAYVNDVLSTDVYSSDISSAAHYAVHTTHNTLHTSPTLQNTLLPSPTYTESAHNTAITADLSAIAVDATVNDSGTPTAGITVVEGKSVGTVGWGVYWFYFQACGGVRAVAGIILGTAFTSAAW